MAIKSIETLIEENQAAIDAIEGGAEEYYIGSRRVRRGSLDSLYKERSRLREEYFSTQATGTSMSSLGEMGRIL